MRICNWWVCGLIGALPALFIGCGEIRQALSPELRNLSKNYGAVTVPGQDDIVTFQGRPIDDDDFVQVSQQLKRYGGVKQLDLNGQRQISNKSVLAILTLNQIEVLHLQGTGINLDGLTQLSGLPRLNTLFIEKARFGPEELQKLHTALPRADIVESGWIRGDSWRAPPTAGR